MVKTFFNSSPVLLKFSICRFVKFSFSSSWSSEEIVVDKKDVVEENDEIVIVIVEEFQSVSNLCGELI